MSNHPTPDTVNKAVTAALTARLRDGDACRMCGRTVYWNTTSGMQGQAGTYHHTPTAGLVVVCLRCHINRPFEIPCPEWAPRFTTETAALLGVDLWEAAK